MNCTHTKYYIPDNHGIHDIGDDVRPFLKGQARGLHQVVQGGDPAGFRRLFTLPNIECAKYVKNASKRGAPEKKKKMGRRETRRILGEISLFFAWYI